MYIKLDILIIYVILEVEEHDPRHFMSWELALGIALALYVVILIITRGW